MGSEGPKFVSRIPEIIAEAKQLAALGWTIPMRTTPREMAEMLERGRDQPIDDVFLDYYAREDGENYRKLKEELLEIDELLFWRPLLLQCFEAHEAGFHLVVVPALLTVLEGVTSRIGKRLKADPRPVAKAALKEAHPDSIKRAIWASIDVFLSNLFASSPFSDEPPSTINRHWILHGRDNPQWDQADALRLLQAIHSISR